MAANKDPSKNHLHSPNFTQKGRTQTYTQKVATAFNWWRRNMLGLKGAIRFHSGMFITRAPEFAEMSEARKKQLIVLEKQKTITIQQIDVLLSEINKFQALPLTKTDEWKGRLPKKRKMECHYCKLKTTERCPDLNTAFNCTAYNAENILP